HNILEVPEETDCNGITSVNIVPVAISLKIEKSRKEELQERDICSPGKEKFDRVRKIWKRRWLWLQAN
ncbi:putative protein E6, partial [Trichinella spiralis]|uniref:putative protein E6 n=1 Tax=Trichinella spiralis TaxID=6334 RepID=UPI0001EFE48B